MTLLNELPSFRIKRLQVDLSEASLPVVDNFLSQFADGHSWTEKGKARLRLVGEEVLLSLLEEENDGQAEQKRRLVATIRPESSSAELEIVVASDDAIQGNIESRMMYLDEGQALEDDQGMSIRILRQYASSVHHRQYYGVDIITCRVMDE